MSTLAAYNRGTSKRFFRSFYFLPPARLIAPYSDVFGRGTSTDRRIGIFASCHRSIDRANRLGAALKYVLTLLQKPQIPRSSRHVTLCLVGGHDHDTLRRLLWPPDVRLSVQVHPPEDNCGHAALFFVQILFENTSGSSCVKYITIEAVGRRQRSPSN